MSENRDYVKHITLNINKQTNKHELRNVCYIGLTQRRFFSTCIREMAYELALLAKVEPRNVLDNFFMFKRFMLYTHVSKTIFERVLSAENYG